MAHLQVSASSGRIFTGSVGTADLLDLLAQALQGAVHLQVTITQHISIISTVHTERIRGLLLRLGNEAKVESTTRSTWGSRGSRRSGRTLGKEKKEKKVLPRTIYRT